MVIRTSSEVTHQNRCPGVIAWPALLNTHTNRRVRSRASHLTAGTRAPAHQRRFLSPDRRRLGSKQKAPGGALQDTYGQRSRRILPHTPRNQGFHRRATAIRRPRGTRTLQRERRAGSLATMGRQPGGRVNMDWAAPRKSWSNGICPEVVSVLAAAFRCRSALGADWSKIDQCRMYLHSRLAAT